METKVQQKISVYNQTEFPIGVLSSNNISPFQMTGKERPWGFPKLVQGTWKSVTQFVYVNMFSDMRRRHQMKDAILLGFSAMLDIQNTNDNYLFEEYVKKGIFKKIIENPQLLYKLSTIKSYNLIYKETPYIIDVLNQIRYPKNKILYYSKEKQPPEAIFVSLSEAASVLHGIEIEISKGGVINDDETYTNLTKWSKPAQPEPGMIEWIDLDKLVPLARLRLRNQKIIQDIEIFKSVLLNEFLDYILKTEYPYLEKSLYERAKTQQLELETTETIQSLKNQLYELFIIGGTTDVHKQILQNIDNYQPQQFVLEPYPEKTVQKVPTESLDLNTVPELLPSYESMSSIDGKQYLSVIHYAYDMLIREIYKIYPWINLSSFDINMFKVTDLPDLYSTMKAEWIEKTLLINNEAALEAKLNQHSSILHFLFQTDPYPIVFEDVQDPVLGIGDGNGKNITGKHLMYLRETIDRKTVKNKFLYVNKDLTYNAFLQLWLYSTSLHLRNTLLLFDSPTTRELEYLYSVHTKNVKQRTPNITEQQVLEQAGLTNAQIKAAFPMILVLASKEFGDQYISETQIAQSSLRRYIEKKIQHQNFNNPEDYTEAFEVSKQYLSQATENIKLAPDVDVDTFVKSMLAGKRIDANTEYKPDPDNLSIWSAAFAYFVVEEPTKDSIIQYLEDQEGKACYKTEDLAIAPPEQKEKKTLKLKGKNKNVKIIENKPGEEEDITLDEAAAILEQML